MSMITGPDIDRFRLRVVASALRLESKGLKGKVKASVIARKTLEDHGIKAEKSLVKLHEQFRKFLDDNNI